MPSHPDTYPWILYPQKKHGTRDPEIPPGKDMGAEMPYPPPRTERHMPVKTLPSRKVRWRAVMILTTLLTILMTLLKTLLKMT